MRRRADNEVTFSLLAPQNSHHPPPHESLERGMAPKWLFSLGVMNKTASRHNMWSESHRGGGAKPLPDAGI